MNPDDYPTVESLVQAWTRVEELVRDFLSGLEDEDLTRELLRALGYVPGNFDLLLYVGDQRSMPVHG